jgi:hypothetical protein
VLFVHDDVVQKIHVGKDPAAKHTFPVSRDDAEIFAEQAAKDLLN